MRKGLALMAMVSVFVFGMMTMAALAAEKPGELSADQKTFIRNAASSGDMEVQLGGIAQQKGKNQAVKDFGKRMETDHKTAGDELKALAQKKNVSLAGKLSKGDQAMVDKLNKASGDDFDKQYMAAMVRDHKKDLAMFKKESGRAKDAELKQWIDKTIPTLEDHYKLARETAKTVGAKTK